jgi:hypothetical protein
MRSSNLAMALNDEIVAFLKNEWIPLIYREKIRSLRTRAFELAVREKENEVDLVHTLLGIQLRAGNQMIACPELATARYLRVFARIGCTSVAVPYDITRISSLADELESAWQKTMLVFHDRTIQDIPQTKGRRRGLLVKLMRTEILRTGAGELMPDFDTETSQRGK